MAPIVMIRRGRYKYIHSPADPDQLYDLVAIPASGPIGRRSRAGGDSQSLPRRGRRRWRSDKIDADVRASQRRRRIVDAALTRGEPKSWDFQPFKDAARSYVRNTIPLDDLEAMARFPRVEP